MSTEAEAAIARVMTLADLWEREGESDMAVSKTVTDEDVAMALLTEGASMVENARLIRNAIRGQE